jgi:7-carboxy-7-deazaguanine synthase
MLISEIFYSIQGEGSLTGVPSVFVRTSGCNLRCRWCDTPYASWNPGGREMRVAEILSEVRAHPARHCVLTGGEPMIAKEIHELARGLRENGYHITIETAGTRPPDGIACDLASLSPKLPNSTPEPAAFGSAWTDRHEKTRWNECALRAWMDACPDYQIKFVVANHADLTAVLAHIRGVLKSAPPWKILIMPEGTEPATLNTRRQMLVDFCMENGFRFCDRLHIHLFGNTRGT